MKVGLSNKIKGVVVFIRDGAVNGTVGIELSSGDLIVSSMTMDSIHELGITVGSTAYACVKATDVIVAVDD